MTLIAPAIQHNQPTALLLSDAKLSIGFSIPWSNGFGSFGGQRVVLAEVS